MYQKFFKISIMAAIIAIAVMGCKKDDPKKNDSNDGNMQSVVLKGVVKDANGSPLSGVKVTTGTESVTTDGKGEFSFTKAEVVEKRTIVKFEKNGYFSLTRSREKDDQMFIEAVLQRKENGKISLQTKFSASEAKTLEISGMKVALKASSVVRADGSAYSGNVNADMLYLDPNNENFAELMPGGDLAAVRTDGSNAVLISYGMTDVSLTDDSGNPLQLKDGTPAEVTFPIPAGMENNAPAEMPLWSFDEKTGLWKEEGTATLKGNVYVGKANHFSWINCDYPEEIITIRGRVKCKEGKPAKFVKVVLTAEIGKTYMYTNGNGEYSNGAPTNMPVQISVIADCETDSYNMPPQANGGTTYNVPDIIISCCQEEDPDDPPGTIQKVEEAAVKYLMNGGMYLIIAWKDKGYRFRHDMLMEADATESMITYVINHNTKNIWLGTNIPGNTQWEDIPYDESTKPEEGSNIGYSIDELSMVNYYAGTDIIAGKKCNVYDLGQNGQEQIIMAWNGIVMFYQINGIVYMVAVDVRTSVPDVAFTKTFNLSWFSKK